ncbi:MAG: helix-turn-helix domain-containing protein [Propionibacteriaceae bacterium]|nr:helix-turn-helix domain-containing protein [Propionibacteriaceae bacterium]
MTDDLLTAEQAAKRLGLAEQTLAQWRWLGKGPEFVKLGRAVRYSPDSLDRWLSTRRRGGEPLQCNDSPGSATSSSRAR